jgi:hypothetical protein
MTQEQVDMFELTTRAGQSCAINGYPRVRLSHDTRTLPFSYSQGGPYASDWGTHKKHRLVLAPGHRAHFIVGKFNCDVGVLSTANQIQVSVPGSSGYLTLRFTGKGSGSLQYCKHSPGAGPGNHVDVSRVET